ncbi:MAG: hypothetical protein HYU51_04105 [Candidatus Rokubacteria bacterium]|nr:hypothetical protein [Candidatus Rokubacteria bacterium]
MTENMGGPDMAPDRRTKGADAPLGLPRPQRSEPSRETRDGPRWRASFTGSLIVRTADPAGERETLLEILERNLVQLPHRRRFDWLYRDNPAGPAWAWFAWDTRTARAVGTAAVFPRAIWIGDRLARCGQVGDFAVDATHRTLGPAVMLQRSTFEPVDDGLLAFCYDCPPHDRGMAPFLRLGLDATRRTHRYASLLRAEREIRKRIGPSRAVLPLALLANAALAVRARRGTTRASGLEIAEHLGRFGEEFTALDGEVRDASLIRGRRCAEDLNWRYRDDPLHEHHVLTARRGGRLVGFVVVRMAGEDAHVLDLFGDLAAGAAPALLDAAADHARRRRAQTLQALLGEGHDVPDAWRRAGFRPRSAGPHIVAYTHPGAPLGARLRSPAEWLLRNVDLSA